MTALLVAGGILSFLALCVMVDALFPGPRAFVAGALVRLAYLAHPFAARREQERLRRAVWQRIVAVAQKARPRAPRGLQ